MIPVLPGPRSGDGRAFRAWVPGLCLALALLSTNASGSPGSGAAQDKSPDGEPLLVELRAGELVRRTIPALRRGSQILLPVRPLFDIVELSFHLDASGRLEAVREPARVTLIVDPQAGELRIGSARSPVPAEQLAWTGDELYIATPVLETLLGTSLIVDHADLVVTLETVDHLPLALRRTRERNRERLLAGHETVEPDLYFGTRYAAIQGAALAWSLAMPLQGDARNTRYDLRFGAGVMGGALEASYNDQINGSSSPKRLLGSWTQVWPRSAVLRQARFGDVQGTGPRPRPLRGAALTNSPYLRPSTFGETITRGRVEPGWEVELWREGQLVGFDLADENGDFAIPAEVDYGPNVSELRVYGPHGEMYRSLRAHRVDEDRLPPGAFEYSVSGGECQGGDCDGQGNLDIHYGLNRMWTARAGVDGFLLHGDSGIEHPYAELCGLIGRSLTVKAEAVSRGLGRLELGFEPGPDLRVAISRTVYDARTENSALFPPGWLSRDAGQLFFRPVSRMRSTFFTAGATHLEQRHSASLRGNVGMTDQRVGVRWTAEWNGERTLRGVATTTKSLLILGASTRLPGFGLNLTRGIYFRGSAAYDLFRSLRDRIQLTAGKSLGSQGHVEFGVDWSRQGDETFRFTFSSTSLGVQTSSQVLRLPGGEMAGAVNLQGTLLYNEAVGRFEASPYRSVGQGGLSGVVFQDEDGNGHRDPGEPPLSDVTLRTGNRSVRTDRSGRYSIWGLVPFEESRLSLDPSSLRDSRLLPQFTVASVAVPPNGFRRIDLAMTAGVEVGGRLHLVSPSRTPGGRIPLTLRRVSDGVEFPTTTFQDGEFYFMSLLPGDYEVIVADQVLESLGARLEHPDRLYAVRSGQAFVDLEVNLVGVEGMTR